MKNLAIFASGSGSNAEQIICHFEGNNTDAKVVSVVSNNASARVIERAKNHGIATKVFTTKDFRENTAEVIDYLEATKVDYIILAGFLVLIPRELVERFSDRIINIHPALLPKFGGKGMYGMNVHRAVIEEGERETGITIHLVNQEYDKGEIIFQASTPVASTDSAEDVALKVQELEHIHFAKTIHNYIK